VRGHISPNVFRSIGLFMLAVAIFVSISAGFVTGVPLFVMTAVMFGLWWYQRRRLSRV